MSTSNHIYFDNAATTPLLPEVVEEMTQAMTSLSGNPSSIHSQGRNARAKIEEARRTIAEGIQASIGELFFTSSATESNNTIIHQAIRTHKIKRIISSPIEHPCVLNTCKSYADNQEVEVVMLDVKSDGSVDLNQLKSIISSGPKTLVSLMYGNNEIGTINPIKEIAELTHEHGGLVHTDAVQVLGKFPVDVNDLGVDYLSGTAHKIHGPKGIAFMYIKGDHMIPPYMLGGAQERNMRAGTENIYGIAGFAKAFELALQDMESRKTDITELRKYFREELLQAIPDVQINGPQDDEGLYHILSVSFPSTPKNEMLIYNLDIHKICSSAGSACSSGTNTGSHVLEAINPDSDRITIRFSFSHLNTIEEVDQVVQVLKEIMLPNS